jgi:hypothetical protein
MTQVSNSGRQRSKWCNPRQRLLADGVVETEALAQQC